MPCNSAIKAVGAIFGVSLSSRPVILAHLGRRREANCGAEIPLQNVNLRVYDDDDDDDEEEEEEL